MEILLILIYVAICYVVFKLFRIPVNEWSLSTAVLGGIVGLSLLVLTMNYNHPYTANARIYFSVTPILSGVKGRVIEVTENTNVPLKAGDVLFRIDPKPYQYTVDQKKAMLAEAEQNVKQLKASFDQAAAAAERVNAQLQLAQQEYDRQSELLKKNVIAQATLDTATVARLTAELADAQYDLDQTVTTAPGPGFVAQVSLRPGMYTVPAPLRPVMVFVNTGAKDKLLGAA